MFAGGPQTAACRRFDDDPDTCALAWHVSGAGHQASCFVSVACSGCGPSNELAGECANTCQEPIECRNSARDIAAGGSGSGACEQFEGDPESCARAWHVTGDGTAASCFVAESECRPCDSSHGSAGSCMNTCVSPEPRTCDDPTRTDFAGGPGSAPCRGLDGDRAACERAWHIGGFGGAATCFYDAVTETCQGCGPFNEAEGRCDNTCLPPVACDDEGREFVGATGTCGSLTSASACNSAFVLTFDRRPESCYVDEGFCQQCDVLAEIEGQCANACAALPTCGDPSRTIDAGGPESAACGQFDGDTASCMQAWQITSTGQPVSCVAIEHPCRGCDPDSEEDGLCTNDCNPPARRETCELDPSRVIEAGGPGTHACQQFTNDRPSCEQAWHTGRSGAASCFAVTSCLGCGPRNQAAGECRNTCTVGPVCGDGRLDDGEECESGIAASPCDSDEFCDAPTCRCEPLPVCGDGLITSFETCDQTASPNGCAAGDNCVSCAFCVTPPYCGDGVITDDETCDSAIPFPNGCAEEEFCRFDTCHCETPPVCGDGRITGFEICDQSAAPNGCPPDENCGRCSFCASPPVCGDGIITDDETCDSAIPFPSGCAEGTFCRFDICQCEAPPVCGDGQLTGMEFCDQSATPNGCPPGEHCGHCFFCASPPVCGDGLITDGEMCDIGAPFPGGCAEGTFCRFDTCQCEAPEVCGDGQVTGFETCDQSADPNGCPAGEHCGHCFFCASPPVCGDGLITDDETCDVAIPFPGCAEGAFCRSDTCQCEAFPVCGDGQVTGFETCDQSADPTGCPAGEHCGHCFFCAIPPVCGDGLITDDETCDVAIPFPSGCAEEEFCRFDTCQCEVPPVCGDGQLTGFETCDQTASPNGCAVGDNCAFCAFCATPPYCGDGLITDDETCDVAIPFPSSCAEEEFCPFDTCQCEVFVGSPSGALLDVTSAVLG